jgi:4'-phosphopantetheinyl transferase
MESTKTRIFIADVRVWYAPQRLAAAMKEVSKERRERAERLKTVSAKALTVGAEMLLQKAVAQSYGIHGPLAIKVGMDGKPWLRDYPEICFNLSHSGHYVACGLGSRPVGVDIQKMERPNLKLARRFFAPSEADWLWALPAEKQTRGFCDLWALKEAYIKYTGKGFKLPLHTFQVDCHDEEPIHPGTAIIFDGKSMPVLIKNYPNLEDYVLWGVTDTVGFQEKIEWIGL